MSSVKSKAELRKIEEAIQLEKELEEEAERERASKEALEEDLKFWAGAAKAASVKATKRADETADGAGFVLAYGNRI